MKKSLLFIVLICAINTSAQVATTSERTFALDSAQVSEAIDTTISTMDCVKLDRHRGTYYLGTQPLTDDEYINFLKNNCPEAWQRYKTGKAMFVSGISVFGAGGFALSFAGVGALWGIWASMWGDSDFLRACGWIAAGGGIAMLTSLPVFIVGNSLKRNAYEVYNESCLQPLPAKNQPQPQLELSLQSSPNGIGFALKF